MDSTVLRTIKALGLAVLAALAVMPTAACNETSPIEVPGVNQQDNGGGDDQDDSDD